MGLAVGSPPKDMATADVSSEQIPHSAAFEELLEVLTHAVAYISNSSLISTLRGQELGEIQYTPFQRQTIFFVVLREHGYEAELRPVSV